MRLSRVMSITAIAALLIAGSAIVAVEAFAGDHERREHSRESREYPHIHGDWKKPYVPPRTHDSGTHRDSSDRLEDDDRRSRSDYDYLSDDESDE